MNACIGILLAIARRNTVERAAKHMVADALASERAADKAKRH